MNNPLIVSGVGVSFNFKAQLFPEREHILILM